MRTLITKKLCGMNLVAGLLAFLLLIINSVMGSVSVEVYFRDESLNDINMTKPRIYLKNTGTEVVTNIVYYYYFTTSDGQTPVIEDYYTPDENISLESRGDGLYRVKYTLSRTLNPAGIIPDIAGNVISIHYNNWGVLNKSDDYSFISTASFVKNEKIAVYSNGVRIYGTEPDDSGDTTASDTVDLPLRSFALYSTGNTIVKDSCVFTGGGALGSNGYVEIGAVDSVVGNVVSGGNVRLKSQSRINGDIFAGNTITKDDGTVYVSGSENQNASVASITLPLKNLTPGTNDYSLNTDTVTLTPGAYRNLFVNTNCTLKLIPGTYVFNNFWLYYSAHVLFVTTPYQNININIQGDLHIWDGSTFEFSGVHYAPSVQIYTNDPNQINIHADCRISGILTAPLADINLARNVRCEGAIYAKNITVEKKSVINSILVNPEEDDDHDGVSNAIEVTGPLYTDPTVSTSFMDYVIPSQSILDYSQLNNITLDYARFYKRYLNSDGIPFSIKTGTFSGELAPLFQMRNLPEGFSSLPQVPGYSPVGQAMNFKYFPLVSGKKVTVPLPFPDGQLANGTESFMVIRTDNSYNIVAPDAVYPNYLELEVDETVKSLILVQKTTSSGSAVAYLDGGMIYSQNNGSSIRMHLVLRNCSKIHAQNARMTINYTDYTDPLNPVDTFKVFPLDTVNENGSYILKNTDIISFAGAVKVTGVNLTVPQYPISYSATSQSQINRGQSLLIFTDKDISVFNNTSQPVSVYYDINYALESVSIDGDGRILQNRSGDSVSYSYDFYLKDHLGSTRMVLNDLQQVTEKVNYQAYGSMESLDSASSPLPAREKFTGKEYDVQGADFARVEYDIAVSNFNKSTYSSTGSLQVTYNDVATGTRYTKIYPLRVDTVSRTLLFTGSESFNSDIQIEQMVLNATGANCTINNNATVDSFTVSPGKTRKVQLAAASNEIVAYTDSSFYTMNTAVDNTTYFSGTKLFYFGARYYDPELGIWLSVDPEGQFDNLYGYSTNPILMVDEDGNSFLLAALIGAAIGAAVNGTVYAATTKDFKVGDLFKSIGIGAVGGAITGGFGSLGVTSVGSALYASLGNSLSYLVTTPMQGQDITGLGLLAAGTTGLLGGLGTAGTERLLGGALKMSPFANALTEIGMSGISGFSLDAASQAIQNGKVDIGNAVFAGGLSMARTTGRVAWRGAIANPKYFYNKMTKDEQTRLNEGLSKYSGKDINIGKRYTPIRYGGLALRMSGEPGITSRWSTDKVGEKGNYVMMKDVGWQPRHSGNLNTYAHELYHYYVYTNEYQMDNLPGAYKFATDIFTY